MTERTRVNAGRREILAGELITVAGDRRERHVTVVAAVLLGAATAVIVYLPLGSVLSGSFNAFVAAFVLIGAASFFARRRAQLPTRWCVIVPSTVFLFLTAPSQLDRGIDVSFVPVAAYVLGYTLVVALAAAIGASLAGRRGAVHRKAG